MDIFLNILIFSLGWILLVFAAYWLIQGSVKLSYIFKLTPLFIGLVVVGFGTSIPEAGVSMLASIKNQGNIALGNILGSNIINIGLVLGLCAIIRPIGIVNKDIFKREMLIMISSVILLYILSLDLLISRFDGVILILFLVIFCFVSYRAAKRSYHYEEAENFKIEGYLQGITSQFIISLVVLLSILGVLLGANLMLKSGINLGRIFGINPWIIGIVIFAFFTSLPELTVSLIASIKKVHTISIGNIIGSNIFNILFILGIASLIRPIGLQAPVLKLEFPALLIFSSLLLIVMKTEYKITRLEGLLMFLGYIGFIILLITFS